DENSPIILLRARLEALAWLDHLDDGFLEWARILYRVTRLGYAEIQPMLAADPEVGHIAEPSGPTEVLNQACLNLTTLLGLVLLSMANPKIESNAFFDPRRSPLAAPYGVKVSIDPGEAGEQQHS